MAFASFDSKNSNAPMAEINMVPLIDVMLVLLVIFIVTAPLLTQAVKLNLPKTAAHSEANAVPAEKIEFAINAQGALFWNGESVTRAQAVQRFVQASQHQPQPELHLRADQNVAYRAVAHTLADASQAGLTKVGFITEPQIAEPQSQP
jgi:biopolymer transport protein ExbD